MAIDFNISRRHNAEEQINILTAKILTNEANLDAAVFLASFWSLSEGDKEDIDIGFETDMKPSTVHLVISGLKKEYDTLRKSLGGYLLTYATSGGEVLTLDPVDATMSSRYASTLVTWLNEGKDGITS